MSDASDPLPLHRSAAERRAAAAALAEAPGADSPQDQAAQQSVIRALELAEQYYHKNEQSYRDYKLKNTRLRMAGDPWKQAELNGVRTVRRPADPLEVYLHLGDRGKSVTACAIPHRGRGAYCASNSYGPRGSRLYRSASAKREVGQVTLGEIASVARRGRPNSRARVGW